MDAKLDRYLRPVRLINVVLLAAFICTILGNAWSSPGNSRVNIGYQLRRAGNILFLISTLVVIGIVIFMETLSKIRAQRRDPVLIEHFIVLPIMLVRIVYSTVQSFLSSP